MKTPAKPIIVLWGLLADGKWHDARAVLSRLMESVDGGAAARHVEVTRRRQANRAHGEDRPRVKPRPSAEQLTTGRREIARSAMNDAARGGRIEFDLEVRGREVWQSNTPLRCRWVGDPLGVYIEDRTLHARLTAIGRVHAPDRAGNCGECGHPHPCRTVRLSIGEDAPWTVLAVGDGTTETSEWWVFSAGQWSTSGRSP